MSVLCCLSLDVFICPTGSINSWLVRRVEIPMSPWACVGGDLGNSMWKVGSLASRIDQVGTEQTATVVWGSVLLQDPGWGAFMSPQVQ